MLEKITEQELAIFETLAHPKSCAEIMFHDFDNLGSFSEKKFGEVRNYQIPFLSFDTLYYENPKLTKKQNFEIKKGLAEGFALGGRLTGKSLIHLIIDSLIALFHKTFILGTISSSDLNRIRAVMEKILACLKHHPVFNLIKTDAVRSPAYSIRAENGCLLESVNNNLSGKNPGGNWYGKHCDKNWEEESSFLTDAVTHKKKMSEAELGCIYRLSGMTTFSKVSPMGRIFYDLKNKRKIINLPSYVSPYYDKKREEDNIQEFGGKNSHGYQVQILGKVMESGDSVFDMDRIRETYRYDKKGNPVLIKSFEVNKDNYLRFRENIIIEKPINAEQTIVALDKGEGAAPTEIIILFKVNKKFKYEYNITLFKLKPDEDEEVINHIVEKIKPNIIGIDYTSGTGKILYINLIKKYPENVIGVSFNEKIEVDFEKDEKGQVKHDKSGKTLFKTESVVDWSIQCLKDIFYNQKVECLVDYKLDQQFSGVISATSKQGKVLYGYKGANHQFQAWQVFGIVNFLTEFKNVKEIPSKKPGTGAYGF